MMGFSFYQVFFKIVITAFPQMDAANKKLTTDYDLTLRWYDPRLIFRDLNNSTEFNDLDDEDRRYIWSPRVALSNALGPVPREVERFTAVTLEREELEPLPEDPTLPREGNTSEI